MDIDPGNENENAVSMHNIAGSLCFPAFIWKCSLNSLDFPDFGVKSRIFKQFYSEMSGGLPRRIVKVGLLRIDFVIELRKNVKSF